MKIKQFHFSFNLKKTKQPLTSRSGLLWLEQMAQKTGLVSFLQNHLGGCKQRNRGLPVWRQILDLCHLLADGGCSVEDLQLFQGDEAWQQLRGGEPCMAPRTARDLLERLGKEEATFEQLEQIWSRHTWGIQDRVTLDVDATFIPTTKGNAKMSYHGKTGYYPMLGFWAEKGWVLQGEFRTGNQSPGSGAVRFLKKCLQALPQGEASNVRLRSDSAWYNGEVMELCQREGIEFAIGADQTNALMQTIEGIPASHWQPWLPTEEEKQQHPDQEAWQIAETTYSLDSSDLNFRVVVLRKPLIQGELFQGIWKYQCVITNMKWQRHRLMHWYHERATSENWIKEIKTGFALEQLPSASAKSNATFFHIHILAYNLVQAFKHLELNPNWHYTTVKTIRFHFFQVAGVLSKHARKMTLALFHKYPHFDLWKNQIAFSSA